MFETLNFALSVFFRWAKISVYLDISEIVKNATLTRKMWMDGRCMFRS